MTEREEVRRDVRIERTFAAPQSLVWMMWTDPRHFEQWWGPTGATVSVTTMDLHVGGARCINMQMQSPKGAMHMWFVGEHLDIQPEHRLVYTESIADEHGNVISPATMGMPPDHPDTTQITVELEPVGDASTQMVMTHAGIPADSPGASGWEMAFDKLTEYLTRAR